jgi:hypothetical protein
MVHSVIKHRIQNSCHLLGARSKLACESPEQSLSQNGLARQTKQPEHRIGRGQRGFLGSG